MTERNPQAARTGLLLFRAALLVLASPFLLSGIIKAEDFAAATAEVRGLTGMEPAATAAFAVIAVQLGGSGLLLAGGLWTRLGALILSAFTIAATLLAHAWWAKTGFERVRDFNIFWEHMAIVAGLGIAALAADAFQQPRPIAVR